MPKTKHPTTQLKIWMREATTEEQQQLADAATSGSRATLYQVASGHRTMRPERAAIVERVTREMHRATKGRLPRVYRTDLSPECAACEYARRCLGEIALRGDFPVEDGQG